MSNELLQPGNELLQPGSPDADPRLDVRPPNNQIVGADADATGTWESAGIGMVV